MVLFSAVARFAGWSYLPDFITRNALQFIHNAAFPALGLQVPPPRTPAYVRQYRLLFATVVLGYLIYNLLEASNDMPANYYEILGVEPAAEDGELKAAFRAFARRNHPDRVGPEGELLFIEVRDAYESLKDPVRRFAYDRFGPDALQWSNCTTIRDYLHRGLQQSLGFHIASAVFLIAFSFIGKPSPVAFWRYILYLAQFLAEFALILGPSVIMSNPSDTSASGSSTVHENILGAFFPQRVAYQHILLLHQLFIVASVAVSRVAPVLFPPSINDIEGLGVDPRVVQGAVEKIIQLAQGVDNEVRGAVNEDLLSITPRPEDAENKSDGPPRQLTVDPQSLGPLAQELEAIIIESRLATAAQQPGPLQGVFNTAVAKARAAAAQHPAPASRGGSEQRLERWDAQEDTLIADTTQLPPSPISPTPSSQGEKKAAPEIAAQRFPSPRPSPPPPTAVAGFVHPGLARRESHVRARSVSC